MPNSVYKKAVKSKKKYMKKFGDDTNKEYKLSVEANTTVGPALGIKNIVVGDGSENIDREKGVIVGNIRMGFGHYRISMAIASAAQAMGYTPYWFDLLSYSETTGSKIIGHSNDLYSMGSRLSQKSSLFNKIVWESLNSEGFKKLSYNAVDQKNAELMATVFKELPKDIPFLETTTVFYGENSSSATHTLMRWSIFLRFSARCLKIQSSIFSLHLKQKNTFP